MTDRRAKIFADVMTGLIFLVSILVAIAVIVGVMRLVLWMLGVL